MDTPPRAVRSFRGSLLGGLLLRNALLLALLSSALCARQVRAQQAPQALPASVYPLFSEDAGAELLTQAESAIRKALDLQVPGARLAPGLSTTLDPLCGPVKGASMLCLSRMAGPGVVLRGSLRRSGPGWMLTMTALDAQGRLFGPASAKVDAKVSTLQPISELLAALGEKVARGETPVAPAAAPASAPAAAGPRPSAPEAALSAKAPTSHLTRAARWTAIGGGGAIVLGAVSGLVARSLNGQLNDKYQAHTLASADASTYDSVATFSKTANALFVVGGAALVTALVLWASDDDEP